MKKLVLCLIVFVQSQSYGQELLSANNMAEIFYMAGLTKYQEDPRKGSVYFTEPDGTKIEITMYNRATPSDRCNALSELSFNLWINQEMPNVFDNKYYTKDKHIKFFALYEENKSKNQVMFVMTKDFFYIIDNYRTDGKTLSKPNPKFKQVSDLLTVTAVSASMVK